MMHAMSICVCVCCLLHVYVYVSCAVHVCVMCVLWLGPCLVFVAVTICRVCVWVTCPGKSGNYKSKSMTISLFME